MNYNRLLCNVCGWIGSDDDVLHAPSPFNPADELTGCPACKSTGEFVVLCDVAGCPNEPSCGTPVPGGYRSTCHEHMPPTAAAPQE